jgi:hypothetical protein
VYIFQHSLHQVLYLISFPICLDCLVISFQVRRTICRDGFEVTSWRVLTPCI